ncbi:MAG: hypothetical protein MJY93_06815 [Fibrobacter sp.]|nr:hypothetical protein [Fibrobacter sp.]
MKKLAFRIIVIAILFASPSFSEPYKGFRPTFNINPFLVFGDDISLGGEINVTFINEQKYYVTVGSTVRKIMESDTDKPTLYASPNISISRMIGKSEINYIGISIGPEFGVSDIGVSSRAWLDLFGLEVSWTKKRGMGGGIYLYVPLAPVMFFFAFL